MSRPIISHFLITLTLCICLSLTTPAQARWRLLGLNVHKASVQELLVGAEHAINQKQYDTAVDYLEAIDARFPFDERARQAKLDIIYAYYQKGDKAQALAAADRYINLYPRGPDTDYAYYMKGLSEITPKRSMLFNVFHIAISERDLAGIKRGYGAFNRLIHYFPDSKYVPDAKRKMLFIRQLLAEHELNIANFYYRRHAFIGAANRAANVVLYYQDTQLDKPALKLMAKSYQAMGEHKLTNDATAKM